MRRALLLALLSALTLAAGATAAAPATTDAATACLSAHRVIVNPMSLKEAQVPSMLRGPGTAVLSANFGLLGAQALDNAILIFEADAGSASAMKHRYDAYVLGSAPKRDRKPAQDFVKYNEQLANNVIVFWPLGYPARPKPASRALVARCVSG